MFKVLGIINILLMIILTSLYWLLALNKHTLKLRSSGYFSFQKFLSPV